MVVDHVFSSPNSRPTLESLLKRDYVKKHLKGETWLLKSIQDVAYPVIIGIYFDTLSTSRAQTNPNTTLQKSNLKKQLEQIGLSEDYLMADDEASNDPQPKRDSTDMKLKRLSSRDKLRSDALKRENYRQQVIKVCSSLVHQ